jgi:acetyltransferase-like isoleucine patch superfamily enzyme
MKFLSIASRIYRRIHLRGHHPSVTRIVFDTGAKLAPQNVSKIVMEHGASMSVGKRTKLFRRDARNPDNSPTTISLRHSASLKLDDDVILYTGTTIFGWGHSQIRIGNRTYLNPRSSITAGADISIGEDCAISWNVQIISDDMHIATGSRMSGSSRAPVTIGNHVWIGTNALVLKGTEIGHDSVVAAGSVVTGGAYPPHSLIAGNPARVIRSDVDWRDLTREEKTSKLGTIELADEFADPEIRITGTASDKATQTHTS